MPRLHGVLTGPPLPGELLADVEGYEATERDRFRLRLGEGIVGVADA